MHIVFDRPGHAIHTPKQNRIDRYQSSEHINTQFSDETIVPKNWARTSAVSFMQTTATSQSGGHHSSVPQPVNCFLVARN